MRLPIFLAGMGSLCIATFAYAGECETIKFVDGRSIGVRSAFVHVRNATMEWPWGTKISSVSIVPPVGDQFVEVYSIIIEPQSELSAVRREVCMKDSGERSCSNYATQSGASVSIYFNSRTLVSRDLLLQRVRDYIDKQVLACP